MPVQRNAAIDIFRGLTVFLMIVVNTLGAGAEPYPFLVHAAWIGFTGADFVFPSFLFAMGCSLVFVLKRPMRERAFLAKIGRRALLLFAIGFLMYWYPFVHLNPDGGFSLNRLADTRIMGVLQRLALCYFLAALAARYLSPKQIAVLGLAILVSYWGLLVWGAPPGEAFDKLGNLGTEIDRLVLGPSHMWHWDDGFEPEGLLGTLPATVNVLAGFLVCRTLIAAPATARRVLLLGLGGVALVAAALFWSPWFPLSKKLWTGSFVLLTVGLDCVLMAGLVALFDLAALPRTRFFDILGTNPLAIYLFSELVIPTQALFKAVIKTDPYQWIGIHLFQAVAPGALGTLLCGLAYTMLCWLFGYILYRKRIFIRL